MSEHTMKPEELTAALEARPFPRVTKEAIEAKIASVEYQSLETIPGLTICLIVMNNGFFFLGKSAPVDMRNFNPDIGKHFAYEDAFKQIWSHEGYLLKEKLHAEAEAEA